MKFLFTLVLVIFPLNIFAQSTDLFSETAIIEILPEYPAPGETVTAKVKSSYYEDLSRAEIIWHINEVEQKRGIGEISFQFQAPENGKKAEVFATVKRGGITYANFINIQPGNLDLIYEANTYIPPFYKGRSLFTPQSSVTIAAVADLLEGGVSLPKNKIIYKWYVKNNYISDLSGVGKDSATFAGDILDRPLEVSVIAESLEGNVKARKRVSLSAIKPEVVLYENNPIFGSIFEKALKGIYDFDREEVGITAVPYYFSSNKRDSEDLRYTWFENGKEVGGGTLGSFINYLNPNKEKNGVSNLQVRVRNDVEFLQSGSDSFKVNVLGNQQSDTIEPNENSAF